MYQVYPRSFADSDGDGLGDLQGVTGKAEYLAGLGIDALWLSPFYPSALADGGYDVDDYRDVDPRLGTLTDFDDMTHALHRAGIKVIVDIVPNHSSNRHAWFREALAAPRGSAARDRYIFRDGTGPDGSEPPSDWQSVFGGSAWEQVPDGQWYLHLFAPEQPDFNWDNREVRDEFLKTLRFWSDRGVDGFRIDVAHALAKDLTEPLPATADLAAEGEGTDGRHPFWDRDEVQDIYAEWRDLFNEYDPPRTAVAEAWVHSTRRGRYASADGLGQAFNFDLLRADFDAARFRSVITANLDLAAATGASSTWVLSNHDVARHATRYGLPHAPAGSTKGQDGKAWVLGGGAEQELDRALGLRRARAATLLMLALPGSSYIYQGEELGLHEVAGIPDEHRQDPTFFRNTGVDKGRDGCRVPLPWCPDTPSFGFSTAPAHLPQPEWFAAAAVSVQEGPPASTLNFYRRALELRRKQLAGESLAWVDSADTVLHFRRTGGWQSITNFGSDSVPLPDGELLHSSAPLSDGLLPPDTTAWLA